VPNWLEMLAITLNLRPLDVFAKSTSPADKPETPLLAVTCVGDEEESIIAENDTAVDGPNPDAVLSLPPEFTINGPVRAVILTVLP
jgi:hypothetical protein